MGDAESFKRFEAAGWSEKAATYDSLSGRLTAQAVEPLLDAAAVSSGVRVLDVATGPGYVASAAAKRGARPLGIDISEGMLAVARGSHPGLEFQQADVEQLPFDDSSFEAVVGNFVVNHLAQPEMAAAECARVLGSGGRLAFTAWDVSGENRFMGVLADAVAAEPDLIAGPEPPAGPDPVRFADDEEFISLLRQAGLTNVQVESLRFTHQAESADELWAGMLGGSIRTASTIAAQPDQVQERMKERFAAAVEAYRGVEGLIQLPAAAKLAAGQKP